MMVSGTRDNPIPEASLSSVYIWKRGSGRRVKVNLAWLYILSEAYHPEAFNFRYTFETMLPIIPDQWKSLFQFLPILGNSE